jgi:hypothetical protein
MLSFALPAALWLSLAVLPVILFYFLRMRFRKRPVGSNFIWRTLLASTRGGNRLRRRSLLLLALQVGAVAFAALAASVPFTRILAGSGPGVAFIVDTSASMGLPDGASGTGPTRLDTAKARVLAELDKIPAGSPVTVFACGSSVTRVWGPGASRDGARAAVASLRPGEDGFGEAEAASFLTGWLAAQDGSWRGILVTDGGVDLGGRALASAFGGRLTTLAVGGPGGGVSISGFRLSPADEASTSKALLNAWNGGERPASVTVRVSGNGAILASGGFDLAPGANRIALALPVSASADGWMAEIVGGAGPGSRRYLAVNEPEDISVLVVGKPDPFITASLSRRGITLTRLDAFPRNPKSGRWNVVIADGVAAPADFSGNLLAFGRPPLGSPVAVAGTADGPLVPADYLHPLSRFIEWGRGRVSGGTVLGVGPGVQVLATVDGRPSLVAWERDGFRYAVFGADPLHSDIGLSESFPVFIQNFLLWCVPRVDAQSSFTLTVGETASRAVPDSWRLEGGGSVRLGRSGGNVGIEPLRAGLYRWKDGEREGFLAANVPEGEFTAQPRTLAIGGGGSAPGFSRIPRVRPFGDLALLLFAACLIAEWFLWRGLPKERR